MSAGMGMIVYDGIGPNLDMRAARASTAAMAAMEAGARRIETAAKSGAPWADRTGQARAGLTADVFLDGGDIVIELYHTMDYGEWLELIQDGRFAIIMPTLEQLGPEVLHQASAAAIGAGLI